MAAGVGGGYESAIICIAASTSDDKSNGSKLEHNRAICIRGSRRSWLFCCGDGSI